MDFYDSLQVLPAELSFGARSLANNSDRLPSLTFVSDLGLRFRPGDSSYIINDRQVRRIELRSAAPGDGYQMSPSDGYILKIPSHSALSARLPTESSCGASPPGP